MNRTARVAVLAGSFDPITLGHLSLINRSLSLCDELVIAIGVNPAKTTFFSEEERIKQVQDAIYPLSLNDNLYPNRVTVSSFQGLLADYAKQVKATILIRGIRSVSDFEYEINLANVNRHLNSNIETIFLPTRPELAVVSSSMVKEIFKCGADISSFVPKNVEQAIKDKFAAIQSRNKKNEKSL
jgi:pantetheine-phosphate adenylyltransferase